jgi:hypothetical protein
VGRRGDHIYEYLQAPPPPVLTSFFLIPSLAPIQLFWEYLTQHNIRQYSLLLAVKTFLVTGNRWCSNVDNIKYIWRLAAYFVLSAVDEKIARTLQVFIFSMQLYRSGYYISDPNPRKFSSRILKKYRYVERCYPNHNFSPYGFQE